MDKLTLNSCQYTFNKLMQAWDLTQVLLYTSIHYQYS